MHVRARCVCASACAERMPTSPRQPAAKHARVSSALAHRQATAGDTAPQRHSKCASATPTTCALAKPRAFAAHQSGRTSRSSSPRTSCRPGQMQRAPGGGGGFVLTAAAAAKRGRKASGVLQARCRGVEGTTQTCSALRACLCAVGEIPSLAATRGPPLAPPPLLLHLHRPP